MQPNAASITLNRVVGGGPSNILGNLSANGQVFLINPNGILFGVGASVNTGGFVASTRNISNADFLNGNYTFSGTSSAEIINQGSINSDGSYVALLGAQISNTGLISAKMGTVALAAGNAVTLDLVGDGLLKVTVKEGAVNALVKNSGMIRADGGQVIMTAKSAGALLNTAVNNTGVVQAQTLSNVNGKIVLLGDMETGTVHVSGTLDASAPNGGNGGFIETSAANVKVANTAKVNTQAAKGKPGRWLIDPSDFNIGGTASNISGSTLSTNLSTGNVEILSSGGSAGGAGNVNVNEAVTWAAVTNLTLTASNNINVKANILATGTTAGVFLNANTANGSETASGTGQLNIDSGMSIGLPNVSPTSITALQINGASYSVINTLGLQGSLTGTDLQGLSGADKAKNYALGSSIDASATGLGAWYTAGGFAPITPLSGNFNGLGHSINGLSINLPSQNYVGLFGSVSSGGTISNTNMVGGSIIGASYVGNLAGWVTGSISNSSSSANITGASYVGGLAGWVAGSVSNVSTTGNINGASYLGGVAGWVTGSVSNVSAAGNVNGASYLGGSIGWITGTLSNSHATGNVTASGDYSGGLAGWATGDAVNLVNNYATGNVSGLADVGGLVGVSTLTTGDISGNYATGSVAGVTNVGGLMGTSTITTGSVFQNFATGNVSGTTNVGGLIGTTTITTGDFYTNYAAGNISGTTSPGGLLGVNTITTGFLKENYATGAVTGTTTVGGLVGVNTASNSGNFWNITASPAALGVGKAMSAADMQQQVNFTSATAANGGVNPGWNFTNTWVVSNDATNPLLQAYLKPLTITANDAMKNYDGLAYNGSAGVSYSVTPDFAKLNLTNLAYTTVGGNINAGNYSIMASGAVSPLSQFSYAITFGAGALTVNKASATVTANSALGNYTGVAQSVSGFSATGLVNGETAASALTNVTASGTGTNAGSYTTTASGTASNYTLSFVDGAMVIAPVAATVTANSALGNYTGLAQSVSGFSATGLVNGELASVLTGVSTSGGTGTNAGSYASTASGSASNYTLSFVDGALAIAPIAATVTANSATKPYTGQSQFVTGYTATGLVNGETVSVLTGITDIDGVGTNVGSYTNRAFGSANNYTLSFVNGALVIIPAATNGVTNTIEAAAYGALAPSDIGIFATSLTNGDKTPMLYALTATPVGAINLGSYNSTITGAGSKAENTLSIVDGKAVIGSVQE